MDKCFIKSDEVKNKKTEDIFKELESSNSGLNDSEAKKRLEKCGKNSIEEKKASIFMKILKYFWGPIPWMIEIAAILSIIVGHYAEFHIILVLLLLNGAVDFWEEFQAGNAIAALKKKLALKCIVKRDNKWSQINADELVPGDIIKLRLGNIIPADAKLIDGDYLSVDQSSITGESLPVNKKKDDIIYSGSVAKQGEMTAIVTATGKNTFFGKTTKLVETAKSVSHFQKAVLKIGDYLIFISLFLAVILIIVELIRGASYLTLIQFVLILIIASIPVALPAVLSVTMALGALMLSKKKAIVTKLESIEEVAGLDVLCCDKTGTLTQNKISLGDSTPFNKNNSPDSLIIQGALASKEENQDPIDLAIINAIKNKDELKNYTQEKYVPFDPVRKRADATIKDNKGNTFYVTKGAAQVIIELCNPDQHAKKNILDTVKSFADKGRRTLGVARSEDGKKWDFLGLLSLFDPIREDSAETIKFAEENGMQIKMLTGDNIAIAKEIAKQIHIGNNIQIAKDIIKKDTNLSSHEFAEKIEKIDGFAEIFPEHKYAIVKALQSNKHIVGMTGDGVNDSPALKQANVGIAVSGSTDAARAAASLVSLAPGLSIIINAIEESRRIFERMNSYSIYRITETIRIMFFMVASILAFRFYPVTVIMIILLALLNDIPILTIAYDNTSLEKKPLRWNMKRILTISTVLGLTGIVSTFLLLFIARNYFLLSVPQIQSFIFLKLSVAGHQTLFVARSKKAFFSKPYPSWILLTAIISTQIVAALIVGVGIFMTAIPWKYIGIIWIYALIWMFIADGIKILCYKHLNFESKHHKKFLKTLKESFKFRFTK